MKSLLTRSESPTISSISLSPMRSPMVIIACLKSRTDILLSWSESNTLRASTKSYRVSLSLPLSCTTYSSVARLKLPVFFGSTFPAISVISVSVGFKLSALTRVPSSVVATYPLLLLSNKSKISLISFCAKPPAVSTIELKIRLTG